MSCLLCFQSILNFDILDTGIPREYCERIFESCNKYLSREIRGSFFQWTYSAKSPIPLCLICLEFSEKLIQINDELESHIEIFTNNVLSARKQINLKPGNFDNKQLNNTVKLSFPGPSSLAQTQVEPVKEERIDIKLIKDEDSFGDGFSDLDDNFITPDSPPNRTEDNYVPAYVSSTVSANNLPELRVTLNRLTFDKDGKIVIPGSKNILGKRKAAISAKAAILKKLVDEETIKIDPNVQKNSRKRYSSDELKRKVPSVRSRVKIESSDCSSDDDEDPPVKRHRRKRNTGKSAENNKRLWIPRIPRFKCDMCDSKFHYGKVLDSHSKITGHVTERNFQCEKCEDKFYTELSLTNHVKDVHEFNKCVCKVCDYVCETKHDFRNHTRAHAVGGCTMKEKFKCDLCDKCFYPTFRLTQHKLSAHGVESPFTCLPCGLTFTRKYVFTAHMEIHKQSHEVPKRTCKKCGHVSQNYIEHRRHIDKHSIRKDKAIKVKERRQRLGKVQYKIVNGEPKKRLACDICEDETFSQSISLLAHQIRVHGKESPFKCSNCKKTFTRKIHLDIHTKNSHSDPMSTNPRRTCKVNCEFCNEVFESRTALRVHKSYAHKSSVVVNTEKPNGDFLCQDCGKIFKQSSQLENHIKVVHLKEISFECSVCKKTFANKPTLTKHEKMHQGITYDCEICGKGFYYKTNLISHTIRIHELKKPPRKSFSRIPGLLIKEAINFRNKQDTQPHPPQIDVQDSLNKSPIDKNNPVASNNEAYFESVSVPKLDINKPLQNGIKE